jgi:predicted PilT family ATPase
MFSEKVNKYFIYTFNKNISKMSINSKEDANKYYQVVNNLVDYIDRVED